VIAQWERFIADQPRRAPPQAAEIAAARQRLEDAIVRHDFARRSRTLLPELDSPAGSGLRRRAQARVAMSSATTIA
jgi:hypothetical protein